MAQVNLRVVTFVAEYGGFVLSVCTPGDRWARVGYQWPLGFHASFGDLK